MRITVVDLYNHQDINGTSVLDATRAVQRQVREDLGPLWNVQAELHVVHLPQLHVDHTIIEEVQRSDGVVYVSPDASTKDAHGRTQVVGFHFLNNTGLPSGFVFPSVPFDWKGAWTVGLSHEILEMIIDPDLNRLIGTSLGGKPVLRPLEVCDPVQATTYKVDGIQVSNFVTRQYFKTRPRRPTGLEPTNFLDIPLKPFEALTPNGYYRFFDPATATWAASGANPWASGRAVVESPSRAFRRERRKCPGGEGIGWEALNGEACSNGLCT